MERIVGRSRELLADAGGWGRFGFYTSGQLFLEEYYTLAVQSRVLPSMCGVPMPAFPRTASV